MGHVASEGNLHEYVQTTYSEDGEAIPSRSSKDFEIPHFSEGVIEVRFLDFQTRAVLDVFRGHSYENEIIQGIVNLYGELLTQGGNAVVLLFGYQHAGPVDVDDGSIVSFHCVGAVAI
ncbi:MAG: immunity 22 family protein [Planctomycetota bacterium]